MENYDDIINLPHHVSSNRPQMSMKDRAAQFSPFAALVGYDAAVKEAGRLTDSRIELDEEGLNDLNVKFQLLIEHFNDTPEVSITYFKADERKAGGAYITATGIVKKTDCFKRLIIMSDGTQIPMDDIFTIEGSLFAILE